MAVYSYPPEVHEFVKEWSPKLRDLNLAEECNKRFGTEFTAQKMKAFRGNHGYRNGKKQWTSEEYWKYQRRYPDGMYEFIRDNSWGVSSQKMADMTNEKFGTNWTATGMKQFRQRHGIKSGETGWYQKGRSPANKGKKLEEYVGEKRAKEIKTRIEKTQFKPGQTPLNELPVGSITKHVDYMYIKVTDEHDYLWDNWKPLHRHVWEQAHGLIPEGMKIIFKDGNRENCNLDNLLMVTAGEVATLNKKGYRSKNPELTEAGLLAIRLSNKAKERRSKNE